MGSNCNLKSLYFLFVNKKPSLGKPSCKKNGHLEMDYPHLQIDHKMSYLSAYLKAGWLNVWDLGLAIHDS